MSRRASLVLAGGQAIRFQTHQLDWQDKALALLDNKPLLVHVVENVSGVVDEVIVCVNDEGRKTKYAKVLERCGLDVKVVVDEEVNVGGPNVALLSGLKATQADLCLTIPCDMPFVLPKVVDYLFELSEGFDVVMPMWPNGTLETLLMVLHRSAGLEIVQTLCQLGRPRPCDIPRAAQKTLLVSPLKTINIDPNLKSFININTPKNLKHPKTRNTQGSVQENTQLTPGNIALSDLQLVRNAAKLQAEDNFVEAQRMFEACKTRFEACGNFFWTAIASEGKAKALQQQFQQQKETTPDSLELKSACREAFSNAAFNYGHEAELYKKKHCQRLLERAVADEKNILDNVSV